MIRFEWDPRKDSQNRLKHRVSFAEASTAFDDPYALIELDLKHTTETEIRERLIGESDVGLVVVIFTQRSPFTRLISARKASRLERALYEATRR